MMRYSLLFILMTLVQMMGFAQNYHAVQGSSQAGSLGIANNPASMVNTPFAWDIDLFSFQVKASTNAITVHKYSLLSSPANSEYAFNSGYKSRFANVNFNVNLLNSRFALSRKKAIAIGINLRGYAQAKTGPYNFIDTLNSTRQFFNLNNSNTVLSGNTTGSSWIEVFAAYGQTIWESNTGRINAGITVKVSRGVSGAHVSLQNGRVVPVVQGNQSAYLLTSAEAKYGYSSNYDTWQKEKNTNANLRDFLSHTEGGASFDLGVEYLVKPQYMATIEDDEDEAYYDYDWKIGISLLDIGLNQFKYGTNSRAASGFRPGVTDRDLDEKFVDIENLKGFNDSLATIANSINQVSGKFTVLNPTRLVLNVDRYLFDAFYVNGDLSVNLTSLMKKRLAVTELNLLTITPRWETKRWGFYLPISYNTEGKFWIGGAFKLGPLLLGVHNWANVFAKNKIQNGGGYLALVIRAPKSASVRRDKRYDCPNP
jgi:hypothetical protein